MIEGMTDPVPQRAEIVVDLAAVRHNVRILKDLVSVDGPVQLMAVVKADGYGHGMVEVAAAARDAGADWLGVATIEEALALRAAGDHGPLLCWLSAPGDDFAAAVAAGVEVTAYSVAELEEIAAAGPARVQLKVDTGLSRGGAPRSGVAAPLRRRERPRAAGADHRHRDLVALRRQRRARPPRQRRPGGGLPRGARPGRRRPGSTRTSPTSPTPPRRSCDPRPTSTSSAAASRPTASTRRPASARASASGPP